MKKTIILFITTIFILFSYNIIVAEDPSNVLPHAFEGYVIDDEGELVPDGTVVSAKINDVFYNTTTKNGLYGSPAGDQFFVVGSADDHENTVIYFYMNGTQTEQTAIFTSGWVNINYDLYFNLSLDTTYPVISSVATSSITSHQAAVSWITDKPSNSVVNYGTTISLGDTKQDSTFLYNHNVIITDLQPGTTYYYEVISYDFSGHMTRDDNSGNYFSFTTSAESPPYNPPGGPPGFPPDIIVDDNSNPIADANGPYYSLIDQTIYFDGSKSEDVDGDIVEYTWNLGDGTEISTENILVTHMYSAIGNYTVTLTVTDDGGATNSTSTFAYISIYDSDGDGWSDEIEIFHGTDPNNSLDYPIDTDGDGILDIIDSDDDGDGLTDEEETILGSNTTDGSDVIKILNDIGLFFLIDTNQDGILDIYYNYSTSLTTDLLVTKDGTFLINIDNDDIYDYEYNPASNKITFYQKIEDDDKGALDNNIIFYILVIIIVISLLTIYIRVGKTKSSVKKPKERVEPVVEKPKEKDVKTKTEADVDKKVDELFKK